ncbi:MULTISPECIES: hypothetical protein [unclassified Myroides]|uniref:hypothetical protein n=1 Tax=unclassified Myroides TaxID=2642485 RepID=UPI003D2F6FF4
MKYVYFSFLLILLQSCTVNQTINGECVGRWVYKTKIDNNKDVVRGRYDKKGWQKGTWRYRYNGKLYKKQQFKNSIAYTTYYHPNGKVAERGQTKLVTTNWGLHYYYFGTWFIYNSQEILTHVKHYDEGQLKYETIVRP